MFRAFCILPLVSLGWGGHPATAATGNRMKMPSDTLDLTGKLLVAMPGMGDPRFAHAVIYMAEHSDKGAMGLMVNKTARGVSLSDVMEHLAQDADAHATDLQVRIGGPVETERGFVLHTEDYQSAMQTMAIADGVSLTATLDILEDIAAGKGPKKAMLMLGYAGWGPGQLEGEIVQNGWLTCDANARLLFDLPDKGKWAAALQSIGIDPLGLSATAGHA
jgi:putative transcriptional regulator